MAAKANTVRKLDISGGDNIVPLNVWVEDPSRAGCCMVQCSQEVIEVTHTASDRLAENLMTYWSDIRTLNGAWTECLRQGMEEMARFMGGRAEVREGPSPCSLAENLLAANQRLFERNAQAMAQAGQALAELPARMFTDPKG